MEDDYENRLRTSLYCCSVCHLVAALWHETDKWKLFAHQMKQNVGFLLVENQDLVCNTLGSSPISHRVFVNLNRTVSGNQWHVKSALWTITRPISFRSGLYLVHGTVHQNNHRANVNGANSGNQPHTKFTMRGENNRDTFNSSWLCEWQAEKYLRWLLVSHSEIVNGALSLWPMWIIIRSNAFSHFSPDWGKAHCTSDWSSVNRRLIVMVSFVNHYTTIGLTPNSVFFCIVLLAAAMFLTYFSICSSLVVVNWRWSCKTLQQDVAVRYPSVPVSVCPWPRQLLVVCFLDDVLGWLLVSVSLTSGQTVELLERPSERPGWCLVRTTDRSPPQEGLVPSSALCVSHSRSSVEMDCFFNSGKGKQILYFFYLL